MLKVAYIRDQEAPVQKLNKKQQRNQQVRELGERWAAKHHRMMEDKTLAELGISRAQYEAMKESLQRLKCK